MVERSSPTTDRERDVLAAPRDADADPRVARSRGRIRAAAITLLAAVGYEGMTMEALASQAGVGKPTVYRHWPGKAELVVEALGCLGTQRPELPSEGPAVERVAAVLRGLVVVLSSSDWGRVMPAVLEAADRDAELGELVDAFLTSRRQRLHGVLVDAVDAGELPPTTDLDHAVDLLVGPLFYARYVRRRPVTEDDVTAVLPPVWAGLGGT